MLFFLHFFLTKETIQSFATMKRGSRKKRIQESKEVTVERKQNLDSKQKVSNVEVKEKKKKAKKILAENQESDSGEEVLREKEEKGSKYLSKKIETL